MLQLFYDVRDAARRTEQPRIWRSAGVSICTFVLVKQVNRVSAYMAPYTGTNVQMLTLKALHFTHVARDCEVLLAYIYMIYIYRPRIRGRVAGGRGRRVRACGEGV